MWLSTFLQEFMEVVQSEKTAKKTRIICTILISVLFLIGIIGLFLLAFVIEGQSFLRRAGFLFLGLGILGNYLQFLKTVMSRRN